MLQKSSSVKKCKWFVRCQNLHVCDLYQYRGINSCLQLGPWTLEATARTDLCALESLEVDVRVALSAPGRGDELPEPVRHCRLTHRPAGHVAVCRETAQHITARHGECHHCGAGRTGQWPLMPASLTDQPPRLPPIRAPSTLHIALPSHPTAPKSSSHPISSYLSSVRFWPQPLT